MFLDVIQDVQTTIENQVAEWCKPVGEFLDNYPEVYKVCIVAIHFFRAGGMFGMMMVSPFDKVPTIGLMASFSFLYRAAVERFCPWKFTLVSGVGALALWAARSAIITIVSGAALTSLALTLHVALGLISLAVYTGMVCYLSHQDVQSYLDRKNAGVAREGACCGSV